MELFPVNLSAAVFNGTNLPSRCNYSMKGAITGFSGDGGLELKFRSAIALPRNEFNTHSGFKHLTINAVGTIKEVSATLGENPGLGPEYLIVVSHKVDFRQVTVNFVVSPTLSTTLIGLNSSILGCQAWFSGLLVGVDIRTKQIGRAHV